MTAKEFRKRYAENGKFRAVVCSSCSFAVNAGYALFNGVLAALYASAWLGAVASYYLALSLVRSYVLLRGARGEGELRQWRVLRACGFALILLTLVLGAAVAQMVTAGGGFRHPGLAIYAAATYTACKTTVAVVNFVKARAQRDPLLLAIRNINLSDALVSVLALQTAMLAEFDDGSLDPAVMNGATGIAVLAAIVLLGAFAAAGAGRAIARAKNGGARDA